MSKAIVAVPWQNGEAVCVGGTGDFANGDCVNTAGDSLCTDGPNYVSPPFDPGTTDWSDADLEPRSEFSPVPPAPLPPSPMTRPFRGTYGFDAHNQRGINLDKPIDDTDFAQKLWVEEQIAAQSRLKGTYTPDSDGLENPLPILANLVPDVDVLTADYWVVDLNGRASSDPMAYVNLNSDDRLVATVSDGGVTGCTLVPALPTGLLATAKVRFEVNDPAYLGGGRSLALLFDVDATGQATNFEIVNPGYNYQVGEILNGSISNTFQNSVAQYTFAPGAFSLLPSTTYYTANITGGSGANFTANFRLDGTGAAVSDIFVINNGINYAVADVLTVQIEGQTVGTITINALHSGIDQPCQVTIDSIGRLTGWDLIRGANLTREQADRDYLRLDGGNSPNDTIDFNQQGIRNLADPVADQDAVNLRSLRNNAGATYYKVTQTGHGFALGDPLYLQFGGIWDRAVANAFETNAWGVCSPIDVDNFYLYVVGQMPWASHGYTVGDDVFLDQANQGTYTVIAPEYGFIQQVFVVIDADSIQVVNQAVQEL